MFEMTPFSSKNDFMPSLFDQFEKQLFGGFRNDFSPIKTDILDKGDHYLVEAELPGFDKDDIEMSVNGDTMVLKAERKAEKEEKKDNYIRKERSYGSFTRSFDISNIKADQISASYQDGVLAITLPKKEETTDEVKKIEIQ